MTVQHNKKCKLFSKQLSHSAYYVQSKPRARKQKFQTSGGHSLENPSKYANHLFGHPMEAQWTNTWNLIEMSSLMAFHTSRQCERKFITHTRYAWGEPIRYKKVWAHMGKLDGVSWAFQETKGLDWGHVSHSWEI